MRIHLLERQQWVPRPLGEVFGFFSRAENLGRITPPWMHFQIRTPLPIEMRRDARIDYRIRLSGIPLRWRTRITCWEPERRFVDEQERGPYALWEHGHHFLPRPGGVVMTDRVRYALPLGPLGGIAHVLALRATLAAIFDYRYERVGELLAARAELGGGK